MTFKALAGAQDRAAGVVWRARDANNYYVARANALEDNFVLYKTVNGVRSALDIVGRKGGYGVSVPVPSNICTVCASTSKARASPPRSTVKKCSRSRIRRLPAREKVGLLTKADSVTLFDKVSCDETK